MLPQQAQTESTEPLRGSNTEPSSFLVTSGIQGKLTGEESPVALSAKLQENGLPAASETSVGNWLVGLLGCSV